MISEMSVAHGMEDIADHHSLHHDDQESEKSEYRKESDKI
jgi:hypothetical protein